MSHNLSAADAQSDFRQILTAAALKIFAWRRLNNEQFTGK